MIGVTPTKHIHSDMIHAYGEYMQKVAGLYISILHEALETTLQIALQARRRLVVYGVHRMKSTIDRGGKRESA